MKWYDGMCNLTVGFFCLRTESILNFFARDPNEWETLLDSQKSNCTIYSNVKLTATEQFHIWNQIDNAKRIWYTFPKAHSIFCTAQSSQWKKRSETVVSLIYFCLLSADELLRMMMHICTHPYNCHCAWVCILCLHSFGKFISCLTATTTAAVASWCALWMLWFSLAGSIWFSPIFSLG